MPWFQPSQSFAEGWNPGPQLSAPDIHGVLGDILQQRRYEEQLRRQQLADMIKTAQNVRGEIQANKYLDAAKQAGVIPEGYEAGGLGGAELGSDLAKQIETKRRTDLAAQQQARLMQIATQRGGGRGGRGGGGGVAEPGEVTGPEFVYDKDGTKYLVVRTSKSVTYHRVPNQSGGGAQGTPKLSPTERGWAAPEIPGLSVNINDPNAPAQTLQPDVPPAPDVSPTPPPADQNVAQDYGVKATYMKAPDGTVSPVDPNLVEYYKSKGAVIVEGP